MLLELLKRVEGFREPKQDIKGVVYDSNTLFVKFIEYLLTVR